MDTNIWHQGWLSTQALGQVSDQAQAWNAFQSDVSRAHIRFQEEPDVLVWENQKRGGYYSTKLGYKTLWANAHQESKWW